MDPLFGETNVLLEFRLAVVVVEGVKDSFQKTFVPKQLVQVELAIGTPLYILVKHLVVTASQGFPRRLADGSVTVIVFVGSQQEGMIWLGHSRRSKELIRIGGRVQMASTFVAKSYQSL